MSKDDFDALAREYSQLADRHDRMVEALTGWREAMREALDNGGISEFYMRSLLELNIKNINRILGDHDE